MKAIKIKRLTRLLGCLLVLALTLSLAMPAMAMPQIPHAFYGSVTVGDGPALDGTVVSAEINGVEYARTTTLDGKYGYSPTFQVPGDDPETSEVEGGGKGDTIKFHIAGVEVTTYTFANGEVTELPLVIAELPHAPAVTTNAATGIGTTTATLKGYLTLGDASSVEVSFEWGTTTAYGSETSAQTMTSTGSFSAALSGLSPSTTYHFRAVAGDVSGLRKSFTTRAISTGGDGGGGGGGGGASYYYADMNLFGTKAHFYIDSSGEIQKKIEATSEDGNLTISIPKRTTALGKNGKRLKSLEIAVDESPPDPPKDAHIIGLPYDFEPDGATFDPPITFTWSYDPDALSKGVAEEDLVLAYYDEEAGEWVELDCVVDTENNTITASVSHFTTIAVIVSIPPPPPAPAPAPAPAPPPAPVPAPAPAPAPPPAPEPAPAPPPPTPEVTPTPAAEGPNWPLIGAIIVGVIVVALLIYYMVIRRRAY